MKLGFFTMPVHPPARSYVETLKEDREAFILADRLGYTEGYCGERIGDFGTLLYCGKDFADPQLGRRSMELMAEKVMPAVNAALGRSVAAE